MNAKRKPMLRMSYQKHAQYLAELSSESICLTFIENSRCSRQKESQQILWHDYVVSSFDSSGKEASVNKDTCVGPDTCLYTCVRTICLHMMHKCIEYSSEGNHIDCVWPKMINVYNSSVMKRNVSKEMLFINKELEIEINAFINFSLISLIFYFLCNCMLRS